MIPDEFTRRAAASQIITLANLFGLPLSWELSAQRGGSMHHYFRSTSLPVVAFAVKSIGQAFWRGRRLQTELRQRKSAFSIATNLIIECSES
jgi:hypothetical protein